MQRCSDFLCDWWHFHFVNDTFCTYFLFVRGKGSGNGRVIRYRKFDVSSWWIDFFGKCMEINRWRFSDEAGFRLFECDTNNYGSCMLCIRLDLVKVRKEKE